MSNSEISKQSQSKTSEELSAGQFFVEMVKVFLLAAIIIIPIRVFLFQPFFVEGASMEPNFEDGEYLIVNELGYKTTEAMIAGKRLFIVEPFLELSRGEPVVFESPRKKGQYLIKRVIGLPGETIEVRQSEIHITNDEHPDGFTFDEGAYLRDSVRTTDVSAVTLGEDEYYLLGDNRMNSLDSRVFGPIGKDVIIGRVLLRAWPLSRVAWFE